MENKNEAKYYFIWLYISLLLHLLLVIIMLTIKPSSTQLTEPDPAFQSVDPTQVIFMTEQPVKQSHDNDEVQPYQLAKKIQGSASERSDHESLAIHDFNISGDSDQDDDKHLDTTSKSLTNEFKAGLKDLTTIKDQLLADVTIQEKVSAANATEGIENPEKTQAITPDAIEDIQEIFVEEIITPHDDINQIADPVELSNRIEHVKKPINATQLTLAKGVSTEPSPKIASKKHRPIEVGLTNQSKIELNKDNAQSAPPINKKISLKDLNLNHGFSDFVRKGNAHFSADGNAEKDNAIGLKRASYTNQVSKMIENAFNMFPELYPLKKDHMITRNSVIHLIIERSGKTTLVSIQSSGEKNYDDFHMKILKFMGDCPPVPKFIEAPFEFNSICLCPDSRSFGLYRPEKLHL